MGERQLIQVKKRVRQIHKILKRQGQDVKLGHIYEEIAHKAGYRGWHAYSARLKCMADVESG